MKIHRHGGRVIEELPESAWRWLALPVWVPYRALISLRNWAYDGGLLPTHRVSVPVISIGNITAGGTGKTPTALQVVQRLRARGLRPAIVSRGYRSDAHGRNDEAQLAGDIPVVCDPNRVRGAQQAIAAGATCIVLDDGFQHRRLARDLDIVLIDATRPWGDRRGNFSAVLPLGLRREGRRGVRRAQLIWLTRTDLVDAAALARLRAQLAALAPHVPIIEESTTAVTLQPLRGGASIAASAWHPTAVVLTSGIGNPAAFEALAIKHGLPVTDSHRFADHHHYTVADVQRLRDATRTSDLVMTGKDAVKIAQFPNATGWVLVADSQITNPAVLDDALKKITK